jgi:hypothetical protein
LAIRVARPSPSGHEYGRDHGKTVQPPLPGQRSDSQYRYRDSQKGIGEVKLIVAKVCGVVCLLILVSLRPQFQLLFFLLGDQPFVIRDGGVITLWGTGVREFWQSKR